jgi:glycosyltransferase involved in cell wall biosynthesis
LKPVDVAEDSDIVGHVKVLYVSAVRLASRTGDAEHVIAVCRQMARQGDEVNLVAVGGTETTPDESGLRIHAEPAGRSAVGMITRVAARARRLVRELRPDIVYVRPFPLDWLFLLRRLRHDGPPYVCELNTVIAAEYRSKGQPLKGWIYEWFYALSIRNALGIVAVTDEIGAWANRISGVRKPILIAGNGVDPDRIRLPVAEERATVRAQLSVPADTLVLAMVGFGRPWHGADRAIAMLTYLGANVQLWLIGAEPSASARAAAMARALRVDGRLRVFPRLESAGLAELLAAADVGLGPLALDRNLMVEAQPIKVRHYLASGLPVLYNYVDPKLHGTLPFVSYVPSTEPQDLAAGIDRLRDLRPDRESVRAFAIEHLSWAAIAAETRRFLSDVLGSAVS